jgi:hypothetical protein
MRIDRLLCAATVAGAMLGSSGVVQAAPPKDMPPVVAQSNFGTKLDSGSTVHVDCPENSVVLSGGFVMGESQAYGVTASKPSGNGWSITVQDVNNFVQDSDEVTVYVTCGSTEYFTSGTIVQSEQAHVYGLITGAAPESPVAVCPRDHVPVGGGFDTASMGVNLLATQPSITAEDGWGWTMTGRDTEFSDDFFITAYAVCAPVAGTPPIQPSETANCFSNVAVAGGALLDGSGVLSAYHPVQGANPTWWEVDEMGGTLKGTSGMCAVVPSGPPAARR